VNAAYWIVGASAVLAPLALLLGVLDKLPIIGPLIEKAFTARFDRHLQRHQAELDRQLKHVQASIDASLEAARARLSRETADYQLWAERRHAHTADLYSEILRAESDVLTALEMTHHTLDKSGEVVALAYDRTYPKAVPAVSANRPEPRDEQYFRRVLADELSSQRAAQVARARHDAHEAFHSHSIYVAPAVELAALEVLKAFDSLESSLRTVGMKDSLPMRYELRTMMQELVAACRRDLGHARPNEERHNLQSPNPTTVASPLVP
jgi:hypothetical protein